MKLHNIIIASVAALTMCACSDVDDQLAALGNRVLALESQVPKLNSTIQALQTIVNNFNDNAALQAVVENTDGSVTLYFLNGEQATLYCGFNGHDGRDGRNGNTPTVGVRQDEDGVWYWTLNGDWLLDANGVKMRASGSDGRNGTNGRNGSDGRDGTNGSDGEDDLDAEIIVPQVRIDPETAEWQISVDGGTTWVSMGVSANGRDGRDGVDGQNGQDGADGRDGQNGQDGRDGTPDVFADIIINNEDHTVTFVLTDGTTFTIPCS